MAGNSVTNRNYNGINILEMRDPNTRAIFYTAFVDNHFVASYTSKLVEAAIDSRDKPKIGLDRAFIEAERLVSGKGLVRVFINYARLPTSDNNTLLPLTIESNVSTLFVISSKDFAFFRHCHVSLPLNFSQSLTGADD